MRESVQPRHTGRRMSSCPVLRLGGRGLWLELEWDVPSSAGMTWSNVGLEA